MEEEAVFKGECVCGSTNFMQEGGKTYCMECQTELESAKEIYYEVVDAGPEIVDATQRSRVLTTTVKKANVKAQELPTSWECFNQLLYNLVDEMEEIEDYICGTINQAFKLTVLQLWAAYLRYHRKAFFSKDSAEYPKFNSRFNILDAEIVYKIKRPKKPQQKKKRTTNVNTRRTERRNIRKMQKLDNQLEIGKRQTENPEPEATQPSIPFQFTSEARRALRTIMSEEHLKEHENDPTLKCHKIRYRDLPIKPEVISKQKLYVLIAMALNHVESEIQLSDFIRFLREGHVSLQNVSPGSTDARYNLDFHNKILRGFPNIHDHLNMRSLATIIAKQIGFKFKKIDMGMLCKRYLHELCLPPEIGTLVDVILNTCPPSMGQGDHQKNYEGRAMAFILFSLKLLFGLDDKREYKISSSASAINEKIMELNFKNPNGVQQKQLFVWSDWVEYIEMRNVILLQLHCPSAMQSYAHSEGMTTMYLDHLKETDEKYAEVKSTLKPNAKFVQRVRDHIQATYKVEPKIKATIKFSPTLCPKRTYMEEVHYNNQTDIFVPAYMKTVHDKRDMEPFLDATKLKSFFHQHKIKLVVQTLKCHGVVKAENSVELEHQEHNFTQYNYYNFNISTENWLKKLKAKQNQVPPKHVPANSPRKLVEDKTKTTRKRPRTTTETVDRHAVKRRRIENANGSQSNNENIFSCVSSNSDDSSDSSEEETTNSGTSLDFFTSNFDYWTLFLSLRGNNIRSEFTDFRHNLSKTFQWLLKQGADLIENQEIDLYYELMAIECYFNKDLSLIEKINSKFDY
ncbi:TATA box-binding protein-associated factor RNA polymerase I subunit B [Pseudolycoriella hygida]|uniref:TATA box-binding protein-associated factor RNA polymerase I subunit B n=1 Tax=Pseudolycoriella hygida TaxID=35572 RepID=A0A9Q0MW79_9DIPT|nr:TATA box-binding protein-associated factor RNA polymerase I subunit B [Pseudolycoriella hygida]